MGLRNKLILLFAVIIGVYVIYGILVNIHINKVAHVYEKIYLNPLSVTRSVLLASRDLEKFEGSMHKALLKKNQDFSKIKGRIRVLNSNIKKNLAFAKKHMLDEQGKSLVLKTAKLQRTVHASSINLLSLLEEGKTKESRKIFKTTVIPLFESGQTLMDECLQWSNREAVGLRINANESHAEIQVTLISIGVILLTLLLVFFVYYMKSIINPLKLLHSSMLSLGGLPHNFKMRIKKYNQFPMVNSFNKMTESIQEQIEHMAKINSKINENKKSISQLNEKALSILDKISAEFKDTESYLETLSGELMYLNKDRGLIRNRLLQVNENIRLISSNLDAFSLKLMNNEAPKIDFKILKLSAKDCSKDILAVAEDIANWSHILDKFKNLIEDNKKTVDKIESLVTSVNDIVRKTESNNILVDEMKSTMNNFNS